jgi:SAM-dependent methyltransferase
MSDEPVRGNRQAWNAKSDRYQARHGPQLDTQPLAWGAWAVPEAEVGALGDVTGKVVLELGCGGGQWSAFLADAGARPIGLDLSEAQLDAAVERMRRPYPLVQADGGGVPLAQGSVDLVISDHGAMSWADPYRTVPEAARVLRPGGRLVFNTSTPWLYVSQGRDGPTEALTSPYFGLHRVEEGDGSWTFVLGYGDWIRLFGRCGLVVEDLIELRPSEGATTSYEAYVPFDWARRWPAESIWVTRRT